MMSYSCRRHRSLNSRYGQDQSLTIHLGERLASQQRHRRCRDDKRLKANGAQHVSRWKRSPLRLDPEIDGTRREQIRNIQIHGGQNVVHIASGKAMKQNAPIIKFPDGETWAAVVMSRTAC
jgi:hypothetical protein